MKNENEVRLTKEIEGLSRWKKYFQASMNDGNVRKKRFEVATEVNDQVRGVSGGGN